MAARSPPCRHSSFKALLLGFVATFFPVFDVPVFWPILLLYWMVLLFVTMRRQIKHMIKYRYVPFSFGKKVSASVSLGEHAAVAVTSSAGSPQKQPTLRLEHAHRLKWSLRLPGAAISCCDPLLKLLLKWSCMVPCMHSSPKVPPSVFSTMQSYRGKNSVKLSK